ncbi:MAG: hypothetical protein KUG81_02325, partial [Gammaproteobacteria bacterium]|nr:hypothetical protein [Gammaproteobacteria bacterium]
QPSPASAMQQAGQVSYYSLDSSIGIRNPRCMQRALEIKNTSAADPARLVPIQMIDDRVDESLAGTGNVDISTTGLQRYLRKSLFQPMEEARLDGANNGVNTAWAGENTGNPVQLTHPPAYDEEGTVANPTYGVLSAGVSRWYFVDQDDLAFCQLQPWITSNTKSYDVRYYSAAQPISKCTTVGQLSTDLELLQQHIIVQGYNYATGVDAYLTEIYAGKTTAANTTVIETDTQPIGSPIGDTLTMSHTLRGLSGKYVAICAFVRNDDLTYGPGDWANYYSSTWNYVGVSNADTRPFRPLSATNFTTGGGVPVDVNPIRRALQNARLHTRLGQGNKSIENGPFCDMKSVFVYSPGCNPRAAIQWGTRDGVIVMDERHKLSYILRVGETAHPSTSHAIGFRAATVYMEDNTMKIVRL